MKAHLTDVRHALLWGPDEPPEMLRGLRRWSAAQVVAVTVVVVVVLAALALVFGIGMHRTPLPGPGGGWWALVMGLSLVLTVLALRRPLLAWRIVVLAMLYEAVFNGLRNPFTWRTEVVAFPDWMPPLLVSPLQVAMVLLVLFLVAAAQPRGVVLWVWLVTVVLVALLPLVASRFLGAAFGSGTAFGPWRHPGWVAEAAELALFDLGPRPLALMAALVVVVTAVVVGGQMVRSQSGTRRELAEVQERGLVLDERARIARELHDVVAHHVSMIAVRSETAPYRLGELPEQAQAEFAEISQASRESLGEMRRLLGVLRSDGPAPTAPQPGLADLAELVESTRSAGTPVTLEMHGSMVGLPAAVDVSAYRILQEALTNAARHATGAAVHLRLRRTDALLSLAVRNGPRDAAGGDHGAPPAGDGHGIRGMRERVAMLAGDFHAGPTGDGGFEVTATLPLRGGDQ
jgi:signal transduction histidine kinase